MLSPESKILLVIDEVINAVGISPREGSLLLERSKFPLLTWVELDQILKKLSAKNLLTVVGVPETILSAWDKTNIKNHYDLRIDDLEQLRSYREDVASNAKDVQLPTDVCRFHFDPRTGVLFRDGCDAALLFGEGDKMYSLLAIAFSTPFGERIYPDMAGCPNGRSLYNAGRNINIKVEGAYKVADFFGLAFKEDYVKRLVR